MVEQLETNPPRYGQHQAPELQKEAVYGLTEINRDEVYIFASNSAHTPLVVRVLRVVVSIPHAPSPLLNNTPQ